MKIEVLQENMSKVLGWVSRFVESKPTIPVMGMMKIQAEKTGVKVFVYSLETAVEIKLAAKVVEKGEVVVPVKLMNEYVGSLPVGRMELAAKEEQLVVKTSSSKATISGMSVDEFSEVPDHGKGVRMEVGVGDLEKVVKLVGFAAAGEPVRPVLSGLLFKVSKKGKLQVVATDGYRLSKLDGLKVGLGKKELKKELEFLVPAKVFGDVVKLVGELGGEKMELEFVEKDKSVVFWAGSVKVVCQLIHGDYPAYERIIPKEVGLKVRVNREELKDVVRLASVFARDNANIVKIVIGQGVMSLVSAAANVGEQESQVEVKFEEGEEEGEIAFNGKYLSELVSSVGGEELMFSMTGSLEPGMFETSTKGFLHIIMPVRTQEG